MGYRCFLGDREVALAPHKAVLLRRRVMDRISSPWIVNNIQVERCSSDQAFDRDDERPYSWLQHYEEGVPVHLEIPDRPLTWLLDKAANRHPNQTAFIYYGSRITYAQFSNLANRFA